METSSGRIPRTAAGLVVLAMAALAVSAVLFLRDRPGGEGGATEQAAPGSVEGIDFEGFDGGEPVAPGSFKGRPLVINYFASWCPPCVAEMPDFERVHQEVGGEVQFLGVARQDQEEAVKELIEKTGVTYRIASDPRSEVFFRMGGIGMPTTYFVDEDGKIIERWSGPLTQESLRSKIREHFGV